MSVDLNTEDIRKAIDHLAILNRYAAYTHAVDSVDPDGYADCFTHDAKNEIGSFKFFHEAPATAKFRQFVDEKGVVTGSENLRKLVKLGFEPFKAHHVTANVLIHSIEADRAKGSAYFVVFTVDGGKIEHYGRYDDELRKCEDGKWRFSVRKDIALYERDHKAERN